MKIVSHLLGRTIVLLPPLEVSPEGGYAPQVFQEIGNRYKFQSCPDFTLPLEKLQTDGLPFRQGSFNDIAIEEVRIYNDGFVISAHTTDQAEAFFDDLHAWAKDKFGLRDPIRRPRRVYASQLVVEFDGSLNNLIKSYESLSRHCSVLLEQTYGQKMPIEAHSFRLDFDRSATPSAYNLTQFFIERRAGYLYSENRYWCQAPLKTSDHISLLEALEKFILK